MAIPLMKDGDNIIAELEFAWGKVKPFYMSLSPESKGEDLKK